MEIIGELLGAAFAGGATGVIGSAISRFFRIFELKRENEAKIAEYAHIERLNQQNIAARGEEMEHDERVAALQVEASLRGDSYRHDESYGRTSETMAAVLRAVRPFLTILLIAITTTIYFTLADFGLRATIVNAVVYLTVTAVTWWFGDRAPQGNSSVMIKKGT